ncbi:hypothetical protein GW756_05095 [bacterium]|nr:hypothetical protein [bacterium]NCQ55754.1 hypothetical protein [Candidatus Parcubacteria bacterium]NCS67703.1 hypothetical protein [Candidatus Peregrinibacteria bacterium]NCS96717.1 hypothetical protein [bacterium]
MGPRITPEQQRENAEAIRGLSAVGIEMADFSLDNLQARLANGLDQVRLNNITPEDSRILQALSNRFVALTNDIAAIESYTLANFKDDFLYITEFLAEPLKSEIANIVRATDQTGLDGLKERWREGVQVAAVPNVARVQQAAQLRNGNEVEGLGLRRIDMLAAPDLNIADTVQAVKAEIEAEGLTNNAEIMRRFRAKLVPSIVDKLEAWARSNDDFVQSLPVNAANANAAGQTEAEILQQLTGATTVGESTVGQAAGNVTDALGNFGGDFRMALSYHFIEEDPLLGALFNNAAGQTPLMTSLFSGNFDANSFGPHIETQLAALFPDTLDFSKIAEQFGTWADRPNGELTAEELQDIRSKLETIPRFFIGGEWEDKYHEYVRNEVAGKGAMDFPEWLMTQVDGIQKIIFQLMLQFTPLMNWWLNDSEDEDIDRYGEHWNEYNTLEEQLRENPPSAPGTTPGAPGNSDPEVLAEASVQYDLLRASYRNLLNDQSAQIEISVDGQPLTLEHVTQFGTELSNIKAMIEAEPQSVQLLSKNLDIVDLNFLALSRNGDQDMNVDFGSDGIELTYDLDALIGEYTAEIGGGVAAGAAAAIFASGGMVLPFLIAGGLTAGAISILGLDEIQLGARSLDYADMNAQSLKSFINVTRNAIGELEESLQGLDQTYLESVIDNFSAHQDKFNWEEITQSGGIPIELLSQDGQISPAFVSMLEQDAEFWDGYQLTRADLVVFAENLDTSRLTSFGSVDDNEGAIVKANPWFRPEGYYVDGSGLLFEERVNNVREFFAWLRS